MSNRRSAQCRLTTFVPEAVDAGRNPIHGDAGARAQGFQGALVPAPHIFGWTVPAIRDALGDRWLDDGWADLRFRRPIYGHREIYVRINPASEDGGSVWDLSVLDDGGESCVVGHAGLGRAPWYAELERPSAIVVGTPLRTLPPLTPQDFPLGRDLTAAAVQVTAADASAYVRAELADDDPIWHGPGARLHPGWLSRRAPEAVRCSYQYGSSIQTGLRIQHLAPARPGSLVCAGRIVGTTS